MVYKRSTADGKVDMEVETSLVFSSKFLSTYQYGQIKSADFFPKMPEKESQLKIIHNKFS